MHHDVAVGCEPKQESGDLGANGDKFSLPGNFSGHLKEVTSFLWASFCPYIMTIRLFIHSLIPTIYIEYAMPATP